MLQRLSIMLICKSSVVGRKIEFRDMQAEPGSMEATSTGPVRSFVAWRGHGY
jgi:hypothetical protein